MNNPASFINHQISQKKKKKKRKKEQISQRK